MGAKVGKDRERDGTDVGGRVGAQDVGTAPRRERPGGRLRVGMASAHPPCSARAPGGLGKGPPCLLGPWEPQGAPARPHCQLPQAAPVEEWHTAPLHSLRPRLAGTHLLVAWGARGLSHLPSSCAGWYLGSQVVGG